METTLTLPFNYTPPLTRATMLAVFDEASIIEVLVEGRYTISHVELSMRTAGQIMQFSRAGNSDDVTWPREMRVKSLPQHKFVVGPSLRDAVIFSTNVQCPPTGANEKEVESD